MGAAQATVAYVASPLDELMPPVHETAFAQWVRLNALRGTFSTPWGTEIACAVGDLQPAPLPNREGNWMLILSNCDW